MVIVRSTQKMKFTVEEGMGLDGLHSICSQGMFLPGKQHDSPFLPTQMGAKRAGRFDPQVFQVLDAY